MKERFKYGGTTHTVLRFAKSENARTITVSKVMNLFNHKFDKPSRVRESIDRLTKYGYLVPKSGGWVITYAGSEYLRTTARPYRGEK